MLVTVEAGSTEESVTVKRLPVIPDKELLVLDTLLILLLLVAARRLIVLDEAMLKSEELLASRDMLDFVASSIDTAIL